MGLYTKINRVQATVSSLDQTLFAIVVVHTAINELPFHWLLVQVALLRLLFLRRCHLRHQVASEPFDLLQIRHNLTLELDALQRSTDGAAEKQQRATIRRSANCGTGTAP